MPKMMYMTHNDTGLVQHKITGSKDKLVDELKKALEWLEGCMKDEECGDICIEISVYL